MNPRFHDHLDACRQCRDNPWGLCAEGVAALKADVDLVSVHFEKQSMTCTCIKGDEFHLDYVCEKHQ